MKQHVPTHKRKTQTALHIIRTLREENLENKPLRPVSVSILLATYNRATTLRRAIESVFEQSFQDWELIVVDDASTDETPSVLAEIARRDERVHVSRNETNLYSRLGLAGPLNKGLDRAMGKYIARLDDDDYWIDTEKLELQVNFLDTHPDCVVVGGGMLAVGAGRKEFVYFKKESDEAMRRSALLSNPFLHTAVMFRADVARMSGGYRTKFAEDWDLWLTMGRYGTFANLARCFTAYSQQDGNYSFVHQREHTRTVLGLLWQHRHEYPGFLKGYLLNLCQYWFSFFPSPLRLPLHWFLVGIKRSAF